MPTPAIVRIGILPFHMVNAHLVIGRHGAMLVDAGLPGSERAVKRALAQRGLTFEDIKLIVITHAHVDHAGNAALLRRLSGAPIVAHHGDLRYFERETPMTYCPTGWAARAFLKTPVPHQPYDAFTPDILLRGDDSLPLDDFGLAGSIRHAGGHTAGSLAVTLDGGRALVGDLAASGILIGGIARLHRAIRPPFEDDPVAVANALFALLTAGNNRFYLGHGGPLDSHAIRRHAKALIAAHSGVG